MAFEKPKIRYNIQFRDYVTFSMQATIITNFFDTIYHKHWWLRELSVARSEKVSTGTFQEILFVK
jgi:hypothetical protein